MPHCGTGLLFAVDFGGRLAIKGVLEALEEGTQAILASVFEHIVTGEALDIDWNDVAYEALAGFATSVILNAPQEYADTALANAGAVGYTETDTAQEDIKSRYSYNYSGTPEHIVDIASALPPAYENMLTNGWKDISVPEEAASGHYRLVESATGLQIRFDRKVEGAPGFHGKDHYHILNPNATGNKDYYLNQNGNVLRKTDTRSHILPKEN